MEVVLVGVNRDTYRNLPWQPLAVSPQQQQMDVVLVGVRNNYGARWDPLHVAGSDGKSVPVTVTNT